MPSICFVHKDLSTIDRGGVCRLLKTIASGLVKKGWIVYAVTTQDLDMPGITTIKLPIRENYEDHLREVSEIVHSIKPDIAECSNWRYELLDFVNKHKDSNTKVVLRCDPPAQSLFDNAEDLGIKENELYHKSDARIAVSKFAKDQLIARYGMEEVILVYNGIEEVPIKQLSNIKNLSSCELINMGEKSSIIKKNVPIEKFLESGKKNVMWVGKPTKMKGFDFLELIVEKSTDEFNFVINTGFSGIECEWKKDNYKKAVFIRGLEKMEQLALWRKMDLSISTSRGEGFGLVVSEALSLGLPVVLNSKCKVFEEFTPNEAVTLADASNPDQYLEAMRSVGKKVDTSRNPSEFTQENLVAGSEKVYKKLLSL